MYAAFCRLNLLVAALLAAAPALAGESARVELYVLQQLQYGDSHYFFDSDYSSGVAMSEESFRRMGSDRVETVRFSNVLVYAVPSREGFSGGIQAVPGLKAWLDARGHMHSLSVLKEQMGFNSELLGRKASPCPGGACRLERGRGTPLMVSTVAVTGIMDKGAMGISLMRLELDYDAFYGRLLDECARRSSLGCRAPPWPNSALAYWAEALAEARGRLDEYAVRLSSAPFRRPEPVKTRPHWRSAPEGEHGGGLEGLGLPDRWDAYEYFKRRETYLLGPGPDEPETRVRESFDPRDMSDEEWKALDAAEKAARGAVHRAEWLGLQLFGRRKP